MVNLQEKHLKRMKEIKICINLYLKTLEMYRKTLLQQKPVPKYEVKSGEGIKKKKLCRPKQKRGRPKKYDLTVL